MISGTSTTNFNGGCGGCTGCGGCSSGCSSPTYTITSTETVQTVDTCDFRLLSIVYPNTPNGAVFDNYALSEAVSYQVFVLII